MSEDVVNDGRPLAELEPMSQLVPFDRIEGIAVIISGEAVYEIASQYMLRPKKRPPGRPLDHLWCLVAPQEAHLRGGRLKIARAKPFDVFFGYARLPHHAPNPIKNRPGVKAEIINRPDFAATLSSWKAKPLKNIEILWPLFSADAEGGTQVGLHKKRDVRKGVVVFDYVIQPLTGFSPTILDHCGLIHLFAGPINSYRAIRENWVD